MNIWDVIDTAAEKYKKYKPLVDVAGSAVKGYLDYKDAKQRNELEQAAYDDYMKEAQAAAEEAQAAVELNLTPMTVSGVPKTKADVTDYTAATGLKHGGISGLRKKYSQGPKEDEVLEMEEEIITPDYLMKEEGVNIGEQVFYNTGRGDRANAMMIWDQMSVPDKSIFDFDFEIFFEDGSWRDWIKGEAPAAEKNKMMASAPSMEDSQNDAAMQLFNKPYDQLNEMELQMFQEEMSKYMAKGGIAGLRKKYSLGTDIEDVETMDEEFVGDNELKMEEGVKIGPMAGPDWYIKRVEHLEYLGYDYDEASRIAYDDDEYYSIVGMESAIPRGGDPEQPPIYLPKPSEDSKGIMAAAKGGRARYSEGVGPMEAIDISINDNLLGNPDYQGGITTSDVINQKKTKSNNIQEMASSFLTTGMDTEEALTTAMMINNASEQVDFDTNLVQTLIQNGATVEEALTQAITIAKGTNVSQMKTGGRVKRDNGGIMNLGGLEKDYRFSGGFVPIGEYERKDDVPARLSKNEFVFTADAVRAAGGGSINKGAKRMYETMKNLEARPEAKRMTA